MERNKQNYYPTNNTHKTKNTYHQYPPENIQNNINQSIFMRYASSIIQVVNEQKLQKQQKYGTQTQPKSPIYEISQVNYYDHEPNNKNTNHIHTSQNNYNILTHPFKKKMHNKQLLVYNFSNLTQLLHSISTLTQPKLKYSFHLIYQHQHKQPPILPKNRASFHSDYTNSSSHQELGTIKTIKLQQKVKRNEEMREGADQIKGWLQFRILMIKNTVFKQMFQSNNKPISSLKPTNNNKHFAQHFDFSQFNNDQSLSLEKSLRRKDEESIVYTADQNFQFSQKDMNIVTPQKFTLEDRFHAHSNQSKTKQNKPTNTHESMVQPYKITNKNSLKSDELNISKPISLKLNEQRRYLNLRTNIYQLPLISDFYFNDEFAGNLKDICLKKDCMVKNEPQAGSDLLNAILRDIQTTSQMKIESKQTPLSSIHSKKQSENSYQSNFNEKSTKLGILQQSKSGRAIHSNKNIIDIKKKQKPSQYLSPDHKKGPIKIQNYYFPGKQIQKNKEEENNNNLQKNNQIQTKYNLNQKIQKPLRFEESFVSNFNLPEQNKYKQIKNNHLINKQRPQHITEVKFSQEKKQNQNNIHINMHPPNQKHSTSPNNIPIQTINHQLHKKQDIANSPQSIQRNRSPYDPLPPKPINEDFNSKLKTQTFVRIASKDKILQPHPYQQNVYQINKQNTVISPPKSYIHFCNPYSNANANANANSNTNDTRKQSQPQIQKQPKLQYQTQLQSQPHNRSHIQPNPQIQPQTQSQPHILINRPHSRLISQPSFPQHQNIQPQNYGLQNFRQSSQKKITFQSPQNQKNTNYIKPIQFTHQIRPQRPQPQNNRRPIAQQYFMMEPQTSNLTDQAVNFNNRYYTATTPSRPPPIMFPQNSKQIILDNSNGRRSHGSQRAQSFKPPSQRINFITNSSPMESQLQYQPSNYFSSRNGSQLTRPKSMNQKIHLTMMRRER